MTNLQAAVGVAQLENLDSALKRKRAIGLTYSQLLADVEMLELPPSETPFAKNLFWVFGVVLSDDFPHSASDIMSALRAQNIGTRPFFLADSRTTGLPGHGVVRGGDPSAC